MLARLAILICYPVQVRYIFQAGQCVSGFDPRRANITDKRGAHHETKGPRITNHTPFPLSYLL